MNRIILFSVLFVFSISSWAQTRMQLAFTTSPSINWMKSSSHEISSEKAILGYDFGISGDIFFSENEHYSLTTGLQVINTGGKIGYQATHDFSFAGLMLQPSNEIKYRLRYLELPLAIKLKTNQFHRLYYWGQFGLSAMVNIGANGDSSDGKLHKDNIHSEVNMFNLAMNVGAGFDFDLGANNSVSAGLIFQNGLTDVTTNNYFNDKTIINSLKLRLALIF